MSRDVKSLVDEYRKKQKLYHLFSSKIADLVGEICSDYEGIQITYREKDPDHLEKKLLQSDHLDIEKLDDVKDLAGVRIMCRTIDDVNKIIKTLTPEFDILEQKNNPSKLGPTEFGYQSQHLIIKLKDNRYNLREYSSFKDLKAEIQIRTILQHAWADIEHGPGYKGSATLPDEYKRRFGAIAATIEILDREFTALARDEQKLDNLYEVAMTKSNWDGIEVNTLSLHQYLKNKFPGKLMWISEGKIKKPIELATIPDHFIDEINSVNIKTIDQLDFLLTNKNVVGMYNDMYQLDNENFALGGWIRYAITFINNKQNFHFKGKREEIYVKYKKAWIAEKTAIPPSKKLKN